MSGGWPRVVLAEQDGRLVAFGPVRAESGLASLTGRLEAGGWAVRGHAELAPGAAWRPQRGITAARKLLHRETVATGYLADDGTTVTVKCSGCGLLISAPRGVGDLAADPVALALMDHRARRCAR